MKSSVRYGNVHPRRVVVAFAVLALVGAATLGYGRAIDWLVEHAPDAVGALSLVDYAIHSLAILIAAWAVDLLAYELLVIGFIERRVKRRMPEILPGLLAAAIYLLALFVIATSILGISAPLVLGAAAGLLILLGAPFRSVIEDVVAGLVLSFHRSFGIGVVIETSDGMIGRVQRLGLTGTILQLADGTVCVVRNSIIGRQGYVLRAALGSLLRRSFTVALPHDVAPPHAMRLLRDAALAIKEVGEAQDPQVLIDSITSEAVVYRLSYGVPQLADAERIHSEIAMAFLLQVDQAGLSLARPADRLRPGSDHPPS